MKLSILIPSVFERYNSLKTLTDHINSQINGNKDVELIVLLENRRRSIGQKRNHLLEMSKGEYVVFVDDDDRISDDYVEKLLAAISYNPDCVIFDVSVTINNGPPKIAKYDYRYGYSEDNNYYYRQPNHIMCYKREIAIRHKYLDLSEQEDTEWAPRASAEIRSQFKIAKVLYMYDFHDKPKSWYFRGN